MDHVTHACILKCFYQLETSSWELLGTLGKCRVFTAEILCIIATKVRALSDCELPDEPMKRETSFNHHFVNEFR